MEKVMCAEHGALCILKTGVKDGATKGKSFYLCATQQTSHCSFVQPADIPASHCLVHEDSIVELQAIHKKLDTLPYRLYYRCIKGKEDKLKWCGNVPWQVPNPNISSTNRGGHQDTQQSRVSENQERNPFKIPAKNQKQFTFCTTTTITTNSSSKQGAEPEPDRKHNKDVDKSVGVGGSPPTYNENATKKSANGLNISERLCDEGEKPHVKDFEKTQKETRHHLKCDARIGGIYSGRNHNLPSDPLPDDRGKVSKVSQIAEKDKVPLESEVKYIHKESLNHLSHHGNSAHVKMDIAKDGQASSSKSTNEKSLSTQKCNGRSVSQENEPTYTPENDVQWKQTTKVERDASSVLTAHKSDTNKPAIEESESCRQIYVKGSVSIATGNIDTTLEQSMPNSHSVDVEQSITTKNPITSYKQATLTAFAGFEYASGKMETKKTAALHNQLTVQLQQRKHTLKTVNIAALPDKGQRLINQVKELEDALSTLHLTASDKQDKGEEMKNRRTNPFDKSVTTLSKPALNEDLKSSALLPRFNKASSLGSSHFSNQVYAADSQQQSACAGQKGQDRLYTINKITSEAIEQLHKSLETCPDTSDEAEDPQYLKVMLLVHQRQALAWLLWREKQRPSGGILADDMGLGKTLTMIALILTQRCKGKKEKEKRTDEWISKAENTLATSNGTLVICPASIIYHWKMEIERHVCAKKLSIYIYHGSNREKSAKVLSEFDVVITTYGLVAKEIPVKNEKGKCTATDEALAESSHSPLLKLAWARIILDEAHNIKNPQIQTSMAVCKLRARTRWAITGTPIQNNLLDMYSLLKFLHCSPFDDFKLWKNQVDNRTSKGGERLNIITRSLLLRRNKGQLDSSGKPLVELPQRSNRSHRLKLSEDEEAVYSVLYARSRLTLQSYLKRHEDKGHQANSSHSADNPFNRVGRDFGINSVSDGPSSSQGASPNSSTIHILSSLLRLRQCCCHLSLLKTALSQTEMEPEGISLSLEQQLNALSLSEVTASDNKTTVTLNGTSFKADLFESTRKSTKITALLEELKVIRSSPEPQKSVIISQWTSMLHVVAAHLDQIKLSHVTLDGTVTPKHRIDMVEEFNTNPKGPKVMLVSLCAGGVGLNLIGGNNLFLLDMHWNPALEEQAADRIYRVGQRKPVTVHRFVCEGSIEDKIFELQEKKKELAKKVLSGTGEMFTKLTLADLRILFGV